MGRRWRVPEAKPGELLARFGRQSRWDSPEIVYAWGAGGASKPDSRILSTALEEAPVYDGRSLCDELERRGYDLTTLRFSIRVKEPRP
jgi:hypothetical protein